VSYLSAVEELKNLSEDIRRAITEVEGSDGDRARIMNACGWIQKSTQSIGQVCALLWATVPAKEALK